MTLTCFGAATSALAAGVELTTWAWANAGAAGASIPSLFIAGSGIHGAEFTREGRLDLDRVKAAIREAGADPIGVAAAFVW